MADINLEDLEGALSDALLKEVALYVRRAIFKQVVEGVNKGLAKNKLDLKAIGMDTGDIADMVEDFFDDYVMGDIQKIPALIVKEIPPIITKITKGIVEDRTYECLEYVGDDVRERVKEYRGQQEEEG